MWLVKNLHHLCSDILFRRNWLNQFHASFLYVASVVKTEMLILIVVVMVKLVYIKGYYDNHHHHVLSVKYMVTMPYPALLFLLNLFSLLLRLPVGEWRIVMSVSIYLSTPTSQEPRVETLLNFLCIFSLSAAGCFSGSIAVHLLISGFLDYVTFAHNGQEEATRTGQYSK